MTDNMIKTANSETMPIAGITITDESDQTSTMEIRFQPDTLLSETLPMMGKGMLGIFVVIGVIILIVHLLNRVSNPREQKQTEK